MQDLELVEKSERNTIFGLGIPTGNSGIPLKTFRLFWKCYSPTEISDFSWGGGGGRGGQIVNTPAVTTRLVKIQTEQSTRVSFFFNSLVNLVTRDYSGKLLLGKTNFKTVIHAFPCFIL